MAVGGLLVRAGQVVVAGLLFSCVAAGGQVRGVPNSKQSDFLNGVHCIPRDSASPSAAPVHVPAERINDNYCDCADGQDEPGSPAACGSSRFYCLNIGHRGKYIPSSFVHDQVCDCCDGSDEPEGKCSNTCSIEGEKEMKEAKIQAAEIMKGVAERASMAKDGARLKSEDEKELAELEKKVKALETECSQSSARLERLRKLRTEAEQLQSWRSRPSEKDGGDGSSPGLANGLVTDGTDVGSQNDDVDSDSGDFEEDYGGDSQGEDSHGEDSGEQDDGGGVGSPIGDVASDGSATEGDGSSGLDANVEGSENGDAESGASGAGPTSSELNASVKDGLEPVQSGDEDSLCAELTGGRASSKLRSISLSMQYMILSRLRRIIPERYMPEFKDSGGDGVRTCVDRAEDADRELQDSKSTAESSLHDVKKRLEVDYGPDSAFRSLVGKCVKNTFTQYDFELCFFDKVQQYEFGSVIASLGSWSSWREGSDYKEMAFKDGDQCWNGPRRSATVRIECGEENRIISVDEPNRCMYNVVFRSPVACTKEQADAILAEASSMNDSDSPKDEL